MSMTHAPCPPSAAVDCDPVVQAAATLYYLQNQKKQGNFIMAEMIGGNYFKYVVQNLPKDNRGCPGHWLFEVAWAYFSQLGIQVKGIRGGWTFGRNLRDVNTFTAGNQMSLSDAIKKTWAYARAKDKISQM